MQTVFAEKLKEMGTSCVAHAAAVQKLNTEAVSQFTKNNPFEKLTAVRNPQDVVDVSRDVHAKVSAAAINYAQELTNLIVKASFDYVTKCNELTAELAHTGHETVKTGLASVAAAATNAGKASK